MSGLKTLQDRITALESGTVANSSTFADQLINVTTSTVKDDLMVTLEHYETGLTNLGINISDFKMIDLIKAIPYTISYVEKNAGIIAGILKKDVTSAFKLNTALTLIKQYFSTEEKFLIQWINHEVDLIFNNGKNTLALIPNTKPSTPVGTISKAKRFSIKSCVKKTV